MIVVNASSVKPEDLPNVVLKVLFSEDVIAGGEIKFGTVTVPPMARIPLNGSGVHEQDEYSIIVKGSIVTGIGSQEYHLSVGGSMLIPSGEAHWAYNDGEEDCEIIWVLAPRS